MYLSKEEFFDVVKNAPLFAIDLVVLINNSILLGMRKNKPAQNYWFVPGGRVQKNEKLADALHRIAEKELHLNLADIPTSRLGVFEHFYQDNTFDAAGFGTHYITLAVVLRLDKLINLDNLPLLEHSGYQFMLFDEALASDNVHQFSKDYLNQLS